MGGNNVQSSYSVPGKVSWALGKTDWRVDRNSPRRNQTVANESLKPNTWKAPLLIGREMRCAGADTDDGGRKDLGVDVGRG